MSISPKDFTSRAVIEQNKRLAAYKSLVKLLGDADIVAAHLNCMSGVSPEGRRAIQLGSKLHRIVTRAIAKAEGITE